MWDRNHNLRAYEGVENLAAYPSAQALERYRRERLTFAAPAVEFIKRRIYQSLPLCVLEIGSGSSCLLYALEDRNILKRAVGIEISCSRYQFAQEWATDYGYQRVQNIHANILDVSVEPCEYDLCLVVDDTFTYFYPESPSMPEQVLRFAYEALKPRGYLLLEMACFRAAVTACESQGWYSHWLELPPTNPFRYALYRYNYYKEEEVIEKESVYLRRNGTEEARKIEFSKVYTNKSLEQLLRLNGFHVCATFENLGQSQYVDGSSDSIVLLGRKSTPEERSN